MCGYISTISDKSLGTLSILCFFFSIIPPLPQNIVADRKQIFLSLFNIARGGGGGGRGFYLNLLVEF